MIRLDTYPMGGPSAGAGPSTPPTLSCLLHSGVLPPHQSLAVWVGGVLQQAEDEDGLAVFSWQCPASTLMEIHLKQERRTIRAWRGWWNGDTTLAHTGTLALHVFCAGVLQQAGLGAPPDAAASSPLLVAPTEYRNGSAALASAPALSTTAVLEWPALAPRTLAPPPVQGTPSREDDLWSREERRETAEPAEEASALGEEEEELEEFEEFGEEALEEREEEFEEEEANTVPDGEQTASHAAATHAAAVSASPPSVISAPAGTIIAAAHAAQVWSLPEHERVVKGLEAVLASLPAKTILVDLRQHAPTPRTSRAVRSRPKTMGLTKELLRTLYGARYWDHGTQLTTSRRREPGMPTRWSMVVDQPASEGLSALVTALEQGFSLLLLDGVTAYAESSRAAVLAVLRERVSNLEVGPCS